MFRAMKERLRELDQDKVNIGFFESEEFQTLLALALQQLQTTHDKEKLRMLAIALANGGTAEFADQSRKELLFRILRDLSPQHVEELRRLLPDDSKRNFPSASWPIAYTPSGEKLAVLQRLAANGLVEEFLKSESSLSGQRFGPAATIDDAERALSRALSTPPSRHFRLSKFGLDFLVFFGATITKE